MVDPKIACLKFLKSKSVAVLSTVSSTNQPMAATIYYTIDDHFIVYFMTKGFTRKYQNLEANREVSLVVGTENIPVTVQIQGTAEKIDNDLEYAQYLGELKNRFFQNTFIAPLFQLQDEKNTIVFYKIIPSWIRWLDLRDTSGQKGFVQILPEI